MKKIILVLLAGSLLIFNSCTKTGPQGPQGYTGAQGPQGNANVIGSDPFTVSQWDQDGSLYKADFNSADITNDIASTGIVEIFKSYGSSGWTNLPDVNGITSTVFNFYTGGFTIYVQNSNGTLPTYPGTITFRMVVISSSLRQAHPNTDWKNYDQAMAAIKAGTVTTPAANN